MFLCNPHLEIDTPTVVNASAPFRGRALLCRIYLKVSLFGITESILDKQQGTANATTRAR
jgi:hypothetical protein